MRIGKIASSVEYRMDGKISNFILKIPKICNFECYENFANFSISKNIKFLILFNFEQ